jgi:hypothetical protein
VTVREYRYTSPDDLPAWEGLGYSYVGASRFGDGQVAVLIMRWVDAETRHEPACTCAECWPVKLARSGR